MKQIMMGILAMAAFQSVSAQNLSFGPTVGVGHSWITGSDNVKFKPGVNIGGTLVYSFNPHWGVGADLRASFMEGVKTKVQSGDNYAQSSLNLAYLRIPAKVYYFFGEYGEKVRPKIYAGPSVGFLLGAKSKTELKTGSNTLESKTDVKDNFKTVDFGFVAGAGANVRLQKNIWLNLDLVYNNGLIDITEASSWNANRNIGVNVGVTFPLGTVK